MTPSLACRRWSSSACRIRAGARPSRRWQCQARPCDREADLLTRLRERLSPFKCPKAVIVVQSCRRPAPERCRKSNSDGASPALRRRTRQEVTDERDRSFGRLPLRRDPLQDRGAAARHQRLPLQHVPPGQWRGIRNLADGSARAGRSRASPSGLLRVSRTARVLRHLRHPCRRPLDPLRTVLRYPGRHARSARPGAPCVTSSLPIGSAGTRSTGACRPMPPMLGRRCSSRRTRSGAKE